MANFNDDDIKKIRKFEEILRRGLYASGAEVQDVYNRVFQTTMTPTSCGTCLRGRIKTMVDALNRYEASIKTEIKPSEASEENKVDTVKAEEKKTVVAKVNKPKGKPKKKK